MAAFPEFLTRVLSAQRPHRHDDLWSVAQRLADLDVGDVVGYDDDERLLFTTGRDPIRLERPGGRPLSPEQLEDLQDHLASLRY